METQLNPKDIKIKEYISKYIKELQRHFEVSDKHMRTLFKEVYHELEPKSFMDNLISMIKSFYSLKIKGKIIK